MILQNFMSQVAGQLRFMQRQRHTQGGRSLGRSVHPPCHSLYKSVTSLPVKLAGGKSNLSCVVAQQTLKCYMHAVLQLLPSVKHTFKLGPKVNLSWVVAQQTLKCYTHVILPSLPYALTFSATDIGRALLALQHAIKAAQLTKLTSFL